MKALSALLQSCHPLDSSILSTRLARAVLPSITNIHTTQLSGSSTSNEPSTSKSRNGKKRARNYESDEMFRTTRQVVCRTAEEGEALLLSIDGWLIWNSELTLWLISSPSTVVQSLFRNSHLSSAIQSVIARVIISSLISLPRMDSSSLSDDPTLIQRVNKKIQEFSVVIGTGTTSVMSKTLPFVIESAFSSDDPEVRSMYLSYFASLIILLGAEQHWSTPPSSSSTSGSFNASRGISVSIQGRRITGRDGDHICFWCGKNDDHV